MAEQEKNIVDAQPETTEDGTRVVRTEGRDFRVEGNVVDGYIGVDPEYRTYANETEKPLLSEQDVDLLEKSGQPTDVEALTMRMVGSGEIAPGEESETAKRADEGAGDDADKSGADKSTADKAKAEGQGQKPGSSVNAETKTGSGNKAAGTTTTEK